MFIFVGIFFVFGLIIGSFLNVVILRLNTGRSFDGRSGCMSCMHKLSWYELIPVFSFLGLGGRCKDCKSKISIQYPLVEFITGVIFALLFFKFQELFYYNIFVFGFTFFYYAFAFSLLFVITVYDLRHKIIPDSLAIIFGLLAFLGLFLFNNTIFSFHIPTLADFSAGFLIALPFALFWFVSSGRWMGLGDAKLAVGLGWLLGMSQVFSATVIAFWIGAIIGLLLVIFSKRYGMKSEIPFAPYLVLGGLLVFLFELHLF
jgi:prepilin signal peptidase PulO-like enzyme (type II secretory pathway)